MELSCAQPVPVLMGWAAWGRSSGAVRSAWGLLVPSRQEEGLLLQESGSSVSHEAITLLQQALIDRELIDW